MSVFLMLSSMHASTLSPLQSPDELSILAAGEREGAGDTSLLLPADRALPGDGTPVLRPVAVSICTETLGDTLLSCLLAAGLPLAAFPVMATKVLCTTKVYMVCRETCLHDL